MPLKNLSSKEEALTIGLTDNLISRLGRLNRFAVRPLSAVDKFGASKKDALAFGKELQVDAVVVGTIQNVDNRLRLNVRLLDVRDGAQIWSKSYDETEGDLFKLQDDLSLQVVNNLIASISDEDAKKLIVHETENMDEFKEFSKGQFFLAKRTKEDIENFKLIFNLVKERGFTLEGAKQKLKRNPDDVINNHEVISRLERVKAELKKIKNQL